MRITLAAAAIGLAFSAPAFGDSATVNQTGIDNYAAIEQENADASVASILQNGNRNQAGSAASGDAAATQGIRQVDTTLARAVIEQRGDDNNAMIDQHAVSNSVLDTRVTQGEQFTSHRNFGSIQQSALSNSFGEVFQDRANDNTGLVTQTGSSHWGQIVQGAWRWNGSFWELTGTPANDNFASVEQSGQRQTVRINQLGDSNSGSSVQSGAWNEALILQEGSFNSATVNQTGTGAALADRNIARITQSGNNHAASATQSGMGNTALINQH